jgi:hypothetical protein
MTPLESTLIEKLETPQIRDQLDLLSKEDVPLHASIVMGVGLGVMLQLSVCPVQIVQLHVFKIVPSSFQTGKGML